MLLRTKKRKKRLRKVNLPEGQLATLVERQTIISMSFFKQLIKSKEMEAKVVATLM